MAGTVPYPNPAHITADMMSAIVPPTGEPHLSSFRSRPDPYPPPPVFHLRAGQEDVGSMVSTACAAEATTISAGAQPTKSPHVFWPFHMDIARQSTDIINPMAHDFYNMPSMECSSMLERVLRSTALMESSDLKHTVYEEEEKVQSEDDQAVVLMTRGRRKKRLTSEQVHVLEGSFELDRKLEADRKQDLAQRLGLEPRQVAVWFQNRRARSKTKHLEQDFAVLRSQYHAVLAETLKLRSEVARLTAELKAATKDRGGYNEEVSPLLTTHPITCNQLTRNAAQVHEGKHPQFETSRGVSLEGKNRGDMVDVISAESPPICCSTSASHGENTPPNDNGLAMNSSSPMSSCGGPQYTAPHNNEPLPSHHNEGTSNPTYTHLPISSLHSGPTIFTHFSTISAPHQYGHLPINNCNTMPLAHHCLATQQLHYPNDNLSFSQTPPFTNNRVGVECIWDLKT